jgi:hypothetical protein
MGTRPAPVTCVVLVKIIPISLAHPGGVYMRLPVLRLAAVALCCCSLSVLPAHAAAPSARAVNLKLADLPAGFARTARKSTATSDEEQFTTHSLAGLLFVASDVMALPSSDLAKVAYDGGKAQVAASFRSEGLKKFTRLAIAPVGNHYIAYQGTGTISGLKITMDLVVFQRGVYFSVLAAGGLAGAFQAPQVLKLAHIIDGRMHQVG